MAVLLQEKKISSVPGENSPREILAAYQKKLLESFALHFQKLSQSIKVDLSKEITKLQKFDPTRRFSPHIYGLYVYIKDAYKKKDLDTLLDHVQFFKNLTLEQVYTDTLEYGSILSESWEIPFVKELKQAVPHDHELESSSNKVQMFPLIDANFESLPPRELQECVSLLKRLDEEQFCEFETYVSRVKLFSSRTLTSATSPRFFGAVYLRLPYATENALLYYLEYLVHEVSHLHLFALMGDDVMIQNRENELFDSPIRVDKRPMMGVFHATFVLARIVRVLRKYRDIAGKTAELNELIEKKENAFREGLKTVLHHANFTESGKAFYDTLETCAFE